MNSWKPFGKQFDITRRYQIFFLLTAVLPILMFSAHLLENVYFKANRNLFKLLESGLLYVEDTVKANHHELAMSARQAAFLSLNDSYHGYLASHKASRFETYLANYRKTNAFDVVLVLSPQKRILFNPSNSKPFNQKSFDKLVSTSVSGRIMTGFERFYDPKSNRLHLAYVASAPIPRSYNDSRIDGVLLIGRYVKNDSAYGTLQRIMLQHKFRVLVREPKGYSLETSGEAFGDTSKTKPEKTSETAPGTPPETGPAGAPKKYATGSPPVIGKIPDNLLKKTRKTASSTQDDEDTILSPELQAQLELASRHGPANENQPGNVFKEDIRGNSYLTRLFPLINQHSETAGFIAISVPHAEFKDFMQQNLAFITLFIVILILWILMAGRWFQRDVIAPMNALAHGLKQAAREDFGTRIPMLPDYHAEAKDTIHSFNTLVKRLEENEQLRATFISMLSHDLKTPLLAQKRVAELLQDNPEFSKDPKLQELLSNLRRSNEDLLDMVYTLLETYRYEDGQIVLMQEPVNLRAIMTQCFETLQPLADESGILLINSVPEDFPNINADPLQLKRLFQNLISNAIQNIPEGCQVLAAAEETPGAYVIRIEDNGPGLSEKVRKRLFERYNSGPKLAKRIGSGLGLFICRMIVELHNGTIKAESAAGQGTQFHIALPKSP